ncbi:MULTISPECIES: zinc-ribbon domain-containing protein [unclassified Cryobacterium]|uniref:zinc-ribbon domain-containing protein n=1 Tax=unclassified Cryobacterium TaxID=2649013 RepID=UPI001069F459|nr:MULTISPECIES: zinc-ribbon domain-containing protein [unclassified Cryobacterium]TFB95737.1 hypothetical protein E3O39_11970 [Cryobacterium sp. MDB2-A-1]TFC12051.1 hypothetical protein E3O35_09530 [Cryobacterium sp. MDB2-A-2]
MSDLTRRFPFDVRPLHRESIASYTERVLAANFATTAHKNYLVRLATKSTKPADVERTWLELLTAKTKRPRLHLVKEPSAWLAHADGTSCEFCTDLLPATRHMCVLCAGGASVEQNPHFDGLVCIRHSRWVGLSTTSDAQHPVGNDHIRAEVQFRKLRRRHRLDVRFFVLLRDSIMTSLTGEVAPLTEAEAFPRIIAVATAITDPNFTLRFFSPQTPYADAHRLLVETLDRMLDDPPDRLVRAIWLYMRPTVWAVRHAVLTDAPFDAAWPHDFPLDPRVARTFTALRDALEPFEAYLGVTGDDPVSAAQFGLTFTSERRLAAPTQTGETRQILAICTVGHQFETDRERPFAPRPTIGPKCPVCHGHLIIPGYNDLASARPDIGAEFDVTRNAGLTAQQVSPGSKETYFWLCPDKGHSYPASASNRTSANSKCPVCLNRLIVPGVNDVATTHPWLLSEWHPAWLQQVPPSKYGSGSKVMNMWLCKRGHEYLMTIADRVQSKGCDECTTGTRRPSTPSLPESHPALAAEWHPTRNEGLSPEEFSASCQDKFYWLCDKGHTFRQRIDRRVAGYKCSVCSRRTLVPNVNDLRTTEPVLVTEFHSYLNGPKDPGRIFAGTDLYWWKCQAHGHVYKQSVPHRVKSKGCPKCPMSERILNR